jgi:hypothetical protein
MKTSLREIVRSQKKNDRWTSWRVHCREETRRWRPRLCYERCNCPETYLSQMSYLIGCGFWRKPAHLFSRERRRPCLSDKGRRIDINQRQELHLMSTILASRSTRYWRHNCSYILGYKSVGCGNGCERRCPCMVVGRGFCQFLVPTYHTLC